MKILSARILEKHTSSLQNAEDRLTTIAEGLDTEVSEEVYRVSTDISEARRELSRINRSFHQDMDELREVLHIRLLTERNDYAWAVNEYSMENLADFDPLTRGIIKTILREYFAYKNLSYEGWETT